jgi:hypothetical protein
LRDLRTSTKPKNEKRNKQLTLSFKSSWMKLPKLNRLKKRSYWQIFKNLRENVINLEVRKLGLNQRSKNKLY